MSDKALLEGLLNIYSPTLEEDRAVSYLVKQMKALGYRAETDGAGNAIGTRGEGENEIILLGHIDTVPGFIPVRTDGDNLYGRGSVDAKGPLACFVCAGARVTPPAGWKVRVIGAVGEEGDSRGAHFVRDRYRPKAVIIGEPSKWDRITLGFKGSVWAQYTVCQNQSHTAHRIESAPERAVRFWNELLAWSQSLEPEGEMSFYQVTPSLRAIHSDSPDGFQETASVKINIRIPPAVSVADLTEKMKELAGDGELQVEDGINAYRADKNTFVVRAMLNGIRHVGGKPGFTYKTGTADMNIVAPAWNCPSLSYGPGDSSLDHTPDEHTSISGYLKGIEALSKGLDLMMREENL